MKQKNIADAYDHITVNGETNYKGKQSYKSPSQSPSQSIPVQSSQSNNYKHSSGTKLDINDYNSSARNYKNTHISSSQNKHPSENIRHYSHRKPYTYSPYNYIDRDYRTRKFSDRPVKNNEFYSKDYHRISENKHVQRDWIDDMCWFHYTKGQSATNCIDPEKCQGHKSFHRKS